MRRIRRYKRTIILVAIALIAAMGSYAFGRSGGDPVRVFTENRCRAGAFITHSDRVGEVPADSDGGGATILSQADKKPVNITKTVGDNLITNGGLESGGNEPEGWLTNIYGKSTAKFNIVAGHAGAQAARVEITKYLGGDANWYPSHIEVQPGHYYQYRDFYRSNVVTRPILNLRSQDGKDQYINLKNAPPSPDWVEYTTTFFVPSNINQIMVYHPLSSTGWLETDDYSLLQGQVTGFKEPMVSLTFDDGWKSTHDAALPLMKRYGFVSTQYLVTGYLGQAKAYMTPGDVYDFRAAGHEIGSHTVDHSDLTKEPAEVVKYQLERSKQDLSTCFVKPTNYAAPYGTYSQPVNQQVERLYATGRSTDTGYNTADDLNPYQLKVQNIEATTTPGQVRDWLETAKNNRLWLILVYHQIDNSPSEHARAPADFESDLKVIKSSGIKVMTVHDAFSKIKPQIASH